jgi:hypothetical protein
MICLSVITYELARRVGKAEAARLFHEQSGGQEESPIALTAGRHEEPCCAAVRVARKLRRQAEVALLHDAGGTSIGQARSRAFSVALQGGADIWVSCDDDVDATSETLTHLLGSIDPDTPQIVIVPCLVRGGDAVNITLDPESSLERVSKTGAVLRRALFGGFGLVAVSRAALQEIGRCWADLVFIDDDGADRIGVFCDFIYNGWYARDDYAFFSRVPKDVRVEVLLTGVSSHAGEKLQLSEVTQYEHIPLPRAYSQRDTEPPPPAP